MKIAGITKTAIWSSLASLLLIALLALGACSEYIEDVTFDGGSSSSEPSSPIGNSSSSGLSSSSGNSNNSGSSSSSYTGPDPRPTAPEAMSGVSALQYFNSKGIKAGWNLGNTLDAVKNWETPIVANETAWGNSLATQALFNGVKESGFDIVRIPVTWIGHIGPAPDYKINEARLRRVAEVIGYAKTAGIKAVVINIHHDGNNTNGDNTTWGFVDMPAAVNSSARKTAIQNQISIVWTQIAEYFKNYGDYLIFETLNEVHNGNWGDGASANEQNILFDWNQAALSAIRATGGNNATRYVAVPGLGSTEPPIVNAAHAREKLLPNDGANGTSKLIVSVHYYDPSQYTVAGLTDQAFLLIHTWGSAAERENLAHEMSSLKTNFIDKGIAVYLGEWGAPTQTRSGMSEEIKNIHLNYIGSVAAAARANGVVPIYWDDGGNGNSEGFRILERSNGRPKAGFWTTVLSTMMDAINNPESFVPPPPPIAGNLGNYRFGLKEDGFTPSYEQAAWELTGAQLIAAKKAGAKLVLVLSQAPDASVQLVWQGPDNSLWWEGGDNILGELGDALPEKGTSWDQVTRTLTIDLSLAFGGDYSSFIAQPSLNLIIAYYGLSGHVNDLGIVSASIMP